MKTEEAQLQVFNVQAKIQWWSGVKRAEDSSDGSGYFNFCGKLI
jgi:hypothetical protein